MCIFCDIVDGKIPSYKVYEDERVLAFLDISQVTRGHTLVIPKKHYDSFLTVDQDDLAYLINKTQAIAKMLNEKLDCQGMNILSNVNEVAGQSVKHFHIHIIPRYSENDSCVIKFNESEKQDLDRLLKEIKGN